ncbi:hypothetical protein ABIC75_000011 [Dyella japonica]|uniref:Integrase DNA-binding domain-containing protein n=1 Tax=Dyella japonica TaxID=231455 RepID=A0ABV2JN92_9GAMM
MKLTELQVRKAAPGDKPKKLADGAGMYLLVAPSGGKLWRLKYRIDGKEKVLALGRYPDVGLAEARSRREDARRQIARGIDPSAERVAERQARTSAEKVESQTFEAVARLWMERQDVVEITANKSRWILETFLFPYIGNRPISEITSRELLDALRATEATGKLETTKRAKIKAGQVFRFAIIEGLTDNDPTPSLRGALRSPKPKHHARADARRDRAWRAQRHSHGEHAAAQDRASGKRVRLLRAPGSVPHSPAAAQRGCRGAGFRRSASVR